MFGHGTFQKWSVQLDTSVLQQPSLERILLPVKVSSFSISLPISSHQQKFASRSGQLTGNFQLHRLAECQQESLVPVLNSSTGDNFRAPHHEGGRIHMPSPAPALNMQRVT
ncbi:uncharacterized protein LOC133541300 isoform X4 [Nerophis ophidion]|uniref:uncharacterized protein LOC133541300 isoform X4 n=1 Tax=Nerophis ophidion TaxID=159077 RepID=UPI002ADF8C7A|nr:uncharacterized protein LOC133541300 isoform X4 [Nerophis ophidion]